jgi:zinc transport system permease protein
MTINFLDPYILTLFAAGGLMALFTSPLGCFLLWRRMSFFGDTLSHSALLGVALGIFFHMSFYGSVLCVCLIISVFLGMKMPGSRVPTDTLLAVISYSCLAFALILLTLGRPLPYDPNSLLFGDLLLVDTYDLWWMFFHCLIVALTLYKNWRPLLLATFNSDLSEAEGTSSKKTNLIFMVLLGSAVASSLKLVGSLLLPALLVIPATIASRFSRTPEGMVAKTILIALIMNTLGIFCALQWNLPTGPSIVALCFMGFTLSLLKR